MVLTVAFVELQLPEVREQLNSSALHHVLAEVHHAVEVVDMSHLGLSVTFSIHCDLNKKIKKSHLSLHYFYIQLVIIYNYIHFACNTKGLYFLSHTADNPLDAVDVGVGVEEDTVRDISISASSPRLLVVTLH